MTSVSKTAGYKLETALREQADIATVRQLIAVAGAHVGDKPVLTGCNGLHTAIIYAYPPDIIGDLVRAGAAVDDRVGTVHRIHVPHYGDTALMMAVKYRKADHVKALLAHGADPDLACGDMDHSALMCAVRLSCEEKAEQHAKIDALLSYGANVLQESAKGETVLDIARYIHQVRRDPASEHILQLFETLHKTAVSRLWRSGIYHDADRPVIRPRDTLKVRKQQRAGGNGP